MKAGNLCFNGMQVPRMGVVLAIGLAALLAGTGDGRAQNGPNPAVDYTKPNWANSPNIRKFVDSLPGLGAANANNLGQFIPVAIADTNTFPGSDYYQIGVFDYTQKMHSDLPPTKLRGYRDLAPGADGQNHYLGPFIVAQRDRPVRLKFSNHLGLGTAGNLFLPVDTTVMGAGLGPSNNVEMYTQNRATVHLHGIFDQWISDGTPHQWITPAGETTSYPKGVGVQDVPDMWFNTAGIPVPAGTAGAKNDPGPGAQTYYWPNQQSARLLWYHDHAYGITRLNVYAGEVSGYLLTDTNEQALITAGIIPSTEIPLIIQDKSFVCDATTPVTTNPACYTTATDPLWDTANWGAGGSLWFPHVYIPNQDPTAPDGTNPYGRWDWGPWFWPPMNPATLLGPPPALSLTPESFMDTPVINGTPYPYLTVQPRAYRFRVLNGCNDRFLNLQLYYADTNLTEVAMVSAQPHTLAGNTNAVPFDADDLPLASATDTVSAVTGLPVGKWPLTWPTDGRDGGVPDPRKAGPAIIQIGNECGFLPQAVVIPSTPVGYEYDRRNIVVLNVSTHAMLVGPAERADIIIDFSSCTNGSTLILYNDSPAPIPGFDSRLDYYTGDPDQSASGQNIGGAPTTLPGFGPNTRTLMQFRVAGTPAAPFNLTALTNALPKTFAADQPPLFVPEKAYGAASNNYARIFDYSMNFAPIGPNPVSSLTLTAGGAGFTTAPTVSFAGGGGVGATAVATINRFVNAITVTRPGAGYTSAPTVSLTGGGGSGASAVATASGFVSAITVNSAGVNYTAPVTVNITGGGGAGATATATMLGGVSAITVDAPGTDYTAVPTVAITGGGGTGARATATLVNSVRALTVAAAGTGYATAPAVTITGGGGAGATATATISAAVRTIAVTAGGAGYTARPTVTLTGGGGTGARATATVTGGRVTAITVNAGGSGYTTVPTVTFTGGGGTGAAATATISGGVSAIVLTAPGTGFTAAPTVTLTGGGGIGARGTATLGGSVSAFTVTAIGANYTTAPTVTISGGGGTGARGTAVLTGSINTVTVTAGGTGYTSAPVISFTGGAGAGALATAMIVNGVISVTVANGGTGYTGAPTVAFTGGGGAGAAATATIGGIVNSLTLTASGSGYTNAPIVAFAGGGGTGVTAVASLAKTIPMQPKAIQELFEANYGRMNATLGVEIPLTTIMTQTTIPYGYIDPPTEVVPNGELQLWKITHNGVDTHSIHVHLVNVQVINRVGWDGMIKPPEPQELGWKETVRMNPLEDVIVALKPEVPIVPFRVPLSNRPLDVTMPLGSTMGFSGLDQFNNPVSVSNVMTRFSWEYVWHCHILGHEENDMMRPLVMQVEPNAPTGLTATVIGAKSVQLTWFDNANNETGQRIERSIGAGAFTTLALISSNITAYTDASVAASNAYNYRVFATNYFGDSLPSETATADVFAPAAPSGLVSTPSLLGTNVPFATLTWVNNAVNATSLTLQRANNTAFTAGLSTFANILPTATTYVDASVARTPITNYYRIQAVNVIGVSPWSNLATNASPGQIPAGPLTLRVTATTRNSIALAWTANVSAGPVTGYYVQRSTAGAAGPWTTIATVNGRTTYTNTGLARTTTYWYQVQAYNAAGVSVFTAVIPGTTL
jgi:FtsP/CotA-like multicopper oxidase with cupredoxin domain